MPIEFLSGSGLNWSSWIANIIFKELYLKKIRTILKFYQKKLIKWMA